MVGHTGMLQPAISAVETIDTCIGRIVDAAARADAAVFITADHGNCEHDDRSGDRPAAHGAHDEPGAVHRRSATICRAQAARRAASSADVAPTVLELMGIAQPAEMDGRSLLE